MKSQKRVYITMSIMIMNDEENFVAMKIDANRPIEKNACFFCCRKKSICYDQKDLFFERTNIVLLNKPKTMQSKKRPYCDDSRDVD